MKLLFLATAISVALSPSVFADDLQVSIDNNSAAIAANTIAAGDNSAAIINNKARTDALSSTLASSSASTNALIAKNKSDAESYISNITQSVAKDSMRIDNLVAGNTNAINKMMHI
ncbi:hypothetical protein FM038_008580 [Shewanella eurypsychrophilus]|uniref:Uncharacterized protein n=1 Tax=Shewanella eurypsychrophilus TaxID=2593656 RepID=A0ABX6V6I2_9GAMM|nr:MULTISPECIES: hypothetical protein [Shewanella]QFU22203.1 hypothetical protein FS418_10160 [Shewanella sp. YLB-09]QPG57489.1 hypothetical protein FM038_008580 [Shewanella eurypsychrophilus]